MSSQTSSNDSNIPNETSTSKQNEIKEKIKSIKEKISKKPQPKIDTESSKKVLPVFPFSRPTLEIQKIRLNDFQRLGELNSSLFHLHYTSYPFSFMSGIRFSDHQLNFNLSLSQVRRMVSSFSFYSSEYSRFLYYGRFDLPKMDASFMVRSHSDQFFPGFYLGVNLNQSKALVSKFFIGFQHKLVSCRWLFDSETMLPGGFFILKSGNFSLGTNYEFTNLSAEPIIDIKTTYRKQEDENEILEINFGLKNLKQIVASVSKQFMYPLQYTNSIHPVILGAEWNDGIASVGLMTQINENACVKFKMNHLGDMQGMIGLTFANWIRKSKLSIGLTGSFHNQRSVTGSATFSLIKEF